MTVLIASTAVTGFAILFVAALYRMTDERKKNERL